MNKIYDGIMGLVVGDALGVPVEFKKRDTFHVTDMIGYGTYNQPPGTWSDDSSMTLATLESIGQFKRIDPLGIMNNFYAWLYYAEFTPYGKVFDVGGGTRRAIARYASGKPLNDCGGRTRMDNGNGSLMRILPLAFIPCSMKDINTISGLTHNHDIAKRACRLYLIVVEQILKSGKVPRWIYTDTDIWTGDFSRVREIWKLNREEIRSSGYVVDTLEAALWCLYHSNTYRDCVLMAVNLGEDTDTVAAVAGGLAGLVYGVGGESGIPEEWISQIARKDWIKGLCDAVESSLSK